MNAVDSHDFKVAQQCFIYMFLVQVVKAWDMCTGKKTFEFSVGSCGISSMGIDKSGKRYKHAKTECL